MLKKLLRYNESYLFILILLISIIITIANPNFLTFENILGFLKSYSMVGIMAVGTLFVLILGGTPDVSFTAIAQVVEYATAVITLALGGNIFLAILMACIMGMIMGMINGLIIHYFRVSTIIVTIATFNIYYGLMYVITRGKLINVVHVMFENFGNTLLFPTTTKIGGTYGLTLMPILWILSLILGWFILSKTFLGRSIFAMGGNEVAAERIGINTMFVRIFVFGFVGFLSGLAAIVHLSIVQAVVPNIIVGKELEVIAAVVIGGASVFGGRGTIIGTFLGVLLFAIINNGLTLLNVSSYWYNITIGIIITLAVTVSAYQKLRQHRARVNVKIENGEGIK